jgi:very-short-patch-repair endonuclease
MATNLRRSSDLIEASSRQMVRTQITRGVLVRVRRGVYAHQAAGADGDLEALFLCLPPQAMLTRQSAAHRCGLDVRVDGKVHVHLPPHVARPRLPGLVVHHGVLPVLKPVLVDGIPCVPPARWAVDLARTARRLDALPVLDAAIRLGLVLPSELYAEVLRHSGLKGIRQARELVRVADGRAECRQESQLRLVLIDGGLPPPELQVWVHDQHGIPRYRVDLGYSERKVGIEYDGASHLDRERLRYDRERANWLDANGWTMRYFTDRDLYRRPSHIVSTVRDALS